MITPIPKKSGNFWPQPKKVPPPEPPWHPSTGQPSPKGSDLKNLRTLPYIKEFGPALLGIENPSRYLGGEFGSRRPLPPAEKLGETLLSAICFPDTYEIGMSNTALKLIYQMLSPDKGQWCGRSFVPSPDMEVLMRSRGTPLVTLEESVVLRDLDVVGITVGFELSATNILNLLDLGGICVRHQDRREDEPLVIGGGPAMTNPIPLGPFFDALIIGEAEACLPDLMENLRQLKVRGWSRSEGKAILARSPYVWMEGKTGTVRRAVWNGFAAEDRRSDFPIPSLKVIQDYASLEIMRGCPQGCRFCHAGIFYRPYRQKDPSLIVREAARQISQNGYRDISLASLSSGDYPGIQELYQTLNQTFAGIGVSFALPSLKVNSFTLPLLEEMSKVKKSGLTFAVETPTEAGQTALNKTVGINDTLAIMREAKALGWKAAKLYFMTGLPFGSPEEDCEGIRQLIVEIRRKVGINLNISIGTFVPKPHTPFQWAPQAEPERAFQAFLGLKNSLRSLGVQVSFQSTFSSFLEGLIARGDQRTGELIYRAWQKGARFDAWDERLNKTAWEEALAETAPELRDRLLAGFDPDQELPWANISMGLAKNHLRNEFEKSKVPVLTQRCLPDCQESCGVCSSKVTVAHKEEHSPLDPAALTPEALFPAGWKGPVFASGAGTEVQIPGMIFSFSKVGSAAYLPHLSLAQVLERSFLRGGVPFRLSPGFSPHIILELGQALSLGIPSLNECAVVQLGSAMEAREFMDRVNPNLPEGIVINQAWPVHAVKECRRMPSLASSLDHSSYVVRLDLDAPAAAAMETLAAHGTSLTDRREVQALVDPLFQSPNPQMTGGAFVLDANFPAPGHEAWFRLDLGKEKPTLRSLLEPVLGKDWQSQGISSLRLDMGSAQGGIIQGYADWLA